MKFEYDWRTYFKIILYDFVKARKSICQPLVSRFLNRLIPCDVIFELLCFDLYTVWQTKYASVLVDKGFILLIDHSYWSKCLYCDVIHNNISVDIAWHLGVKTKRNQNNNSFLGFFTYSICSFSYRELSLFSPS